MESPKCEQHCLEDEMCLIEESKLSKCHETVLSETFFLKYLACGKSWIRHRKTAQNVSSFISLEGNFFEILALSFFISSFQSLCTWHNIAILKQLKLK